MSSNLCQMCGKSTSNPKFCSSSCSAKYNNPKRIRSEESKLKTSNSVREARNAKEFIPVNPHKYCAIRFCKTCGKLIRGGSNKTCSKQCYLSLQSTSMSKRLSDVAFRTKWAPKNRSWLETTMAAFLKDHNIEYIEEYKVTSQTSHYFIDFYIPNLVIGIEVDGTHHEKQREYDEKRDAYILQHHGIRIIRISGRGFKNTNG